MAEVNGIRLLFEQIQNHPLAGVFLATLCVFGVIAWLFKSPENE